jgi:very-short-patch-repair endonuclease
VKMADVGGDSRNEELIELLVEKVENLRPKLLDLSRRNPLISTRLGPKSGSIIRVVDELPDILAFNLLNGTKMRFVPLPPLGEDPKDEQSREFQSALSEARLTDDVYLEAQTTIDPDDENAEEQSKTIERALKDRVREALGMPPHSSAQDITMAQHAKNNGLSPSYDLPLPHEEHEDGRHTDTDIQTLLFSDAMERSLNGILTKCRTWIQETGINVMHAAFGFLEWSEPNGQGSCFAPLILAPVQIDKKRSKEGLEFWVNGLGDEAETNMVLAEKLKLDFGFELPEFEGGSIEEYLAEVSESSPANLEFRVRRQVVLGVFPSARMAMYHDLDTSNSAFEQSEVIKDLIIGSNNSEASPFADEYEVDEPDVEKKVPHLVLDADSSQFSSLVDVADGKNIALEGPPGTGKSQTIVNAIASALADGKKVLFVAEKMAALEVVRSRLEAVRLGEFVLPLQAERSTREQVINSIRDRVEMDAHESAHEYEARLSQFKKLRSELAEYTQALSQKFGNSGLTVHGILGKYIATQEVLNGLPRDIQKVEIDGVEQFSWEKLLSIKEASDRLQKATEKASGVKPHWKGFGLPALDGFLVDDITDLAETASTSYAKLAEQFESLNKFSSEFENTPRAVEELKEALQGLEEVDLEENAALIEKIQTKDQAEFIDQFCELVQSFRDAVSSASKAVSSPDDEVWGERLTRIISFCQDFGLTSATPEAFDEFLHEIEGKQNSLTHLADQLKIFMGAVPVCTRFSMAELKSIRDFVEFVPREILAMRKDTLSIADTALLVRRAKEQAQTLSKEAAQLAERISVSRSKPSSELRGLAVIVEGSGALSWLSSNFRQAKKEYLSLSCSRDFNKSEASSALKALADWQDQTEQYIANPSWKSIFGSHYQELNTDFGLFERVVQFYEEIDSRYPGIENLKIRNFLKNEPVDTLQSIPDFDAQVWEGDYEALQDEIRKLAEQQLTLNSDVEKVGALASEIHKDFVDDIQKLRALQKDCETASSAKNAVNESHEVQSIVGREFVGVDSDVSKLRASACGARKIISLPLNWQKVILGLAQGKQLINFRDLVYGLSKQIGLASESVQALSDKCKVSKEHFISDRNPREIAEFIKQASADEEGMYAHSALKRALTDFQNLGLPNLFELFDLYGVEDANVAYVTDALIARSLSRKVYEKYGQSLSKFNGEHIDSLRSKLASVDRKLIQLSRQRLRKQIKLSAKPPQGNRMGKKSTWTEFSLIDNEINKKKRFISIRDLTKRAGKALQELKPCWMMSPLAVAQYLKKGDVRFDLCIIDEASQMPPEDALGALVRCDRALVVGDTNQLPPTSFFRRMIEDEEVDEDEKVLDESILEMANAAFRPKRRLRWHYRSRHSGLIKFSNRLIYDDDLIVFPSPHEDNESMGVSYVKVDGSYKSGVNGQEASKIIDAILDFMFHDPDRSLGVVTLNQKQRDLIIDELEYGLRNAPWASKYIDDWKERNDGLESFFVKNLENVQGDERDVIFIGTVYGPSEPGGPVMQRFGPINGLAGQRRLNVLFSRAKEQIVTFSSMTAADIRADEYGNPGTYMLKRWLEYSATGVLESGEMTKREPDSVFEEYVIEQIRSMGCEAISQVGVAGYFIDIGVKHPDWPHGFLLGVECDGASYHSAKSARDRDRLRQEVLERLGWHFHRIWSTDWFNDPAKEGARLREKIISRLETLKASPITQPAKVDEEPEELIDRAVPQTEEESHQAAPREMLSDEGVCEGDTVVAQYLSGEKSKIRVTITSGSNDPANGMININEPLAEALLGEEEGEEVEFLVGSYVRRVLIEKIEKKDHVAPTVTPRPQETASQNARTEITRPNIRREEATSNSRQNSSHSTQESSARLNPDRFYDDDYIFVIKQLAMEDIDSLGPITFRHVCERIARKHGFQRTGSQIRKRVWAAISKERKPEKDPNGVNIFWPKDSDSEDFIAFRGLEIGGESRSWKQVPYPEKLGLAVSVIRKHPRADHVEYMARQIGLARLTKPTREELEEFIKAAKLLG